MTRLMQVCFAGTLILTPLSVRAADLVVWWDKGYSAQEDEAVREIIAAFEQKTGKQVELIQPTQDELPGKFDAALAAGQPSDFAFGILLQDYVGSWAFEDRPVDLADAAAGDWNRL